MLINPLLRQYKRRPLLAEVDRVAVVGWSRGRVKSTGRIFENRWTMTFSICDGKIRKFEEYADTQALAAARDVNSCAASDVPST
jgi:ketosteroid isomerase-like protein